MYEKKKKNKRSCFTDWPAPLSFKIYLLIELYLFHVGYTYLWLCVYEAIKVLLCKWVLIIQGWLNKFPDFYHMGIFIDSTHMKL